MSNRIVEPYMFINQNNEVRCYELTTKTNKTFKITRIESIEQLDLLWSHESEHAPFYCDLFGFTGEEKHPISLLLDQLATSILLEEYAELNATLHSKKMDAIVSIRKCVATLASAGLYWDYLSTSRLLTHLNLPILCVSVSRRLS